MPGELATDNRNLRVSHEDRDHVAEQPGTPVRLTITVSGSLRHSTLTVRGPRVPRSRRTFWDWLLRRPPRAALEPVGRGRA